MNWHEQYSSLTEREKDDFSRLVSLLYEQTFLVRDIYDPKERRMIGNRDYRFAERNFPLLKAYLAVSGFGIQADGRRGVIALYNKHFRNRMKVDKLTTYLLYTFRLVYEEHLETASMRREVVVSLREIIGKLYTIGLVDKRMAITHLQSAINRLRKLSMLARVEGSVEDLESRWVIYPTITVAVSDDRIHDLHARMMSGEFEGGVVGGDGETGFGLSGEDTDSDVEDDATSQSDDAFEEEETE